MEVQKPKCKPKQKNPRGEQWPDKKTMSRKTYPPGSATQDGLITVGSEFGRQLGLTEDDFVSCQLVKFGRVMNIQWIEVRPECRRKGIFTALLNRLWTLGYTVQVHNARPNMTKICQKKGFL